MLIVWDYSDTTVFLLWSVDIFGQKFPSLVGLGGFGHMWEAEGHRGVNCDRAWERPGPSCSDHSGPTTQPNIDIVHTGIENLSVPVLFLPGKDQGSVLIG